MTVLDLVNKQLLTGNNLKRPETMLIITILILIALRNIVHPKTEWSKERLLKQFGMSETMPVAGTKGIVLTDKCLSVINL